MNGASPAAAAPVAPGAAAQDATLVAPPTVAPSAFRRILATAAAQQAQEAEADARDGLSTPPPPAPSLAGSVWRGLAQLDAPLLGCSAGSFVYNAGTRPFVSLTALTLPRGPHVRVEPFVCHGAHLPRLHGWRDVLSANASHFLLLGRPPAQGEADDELQALVARLGALFPDALIAAGRAMPPARLGLGASSAAGSGERQAALFSNFAPGSGAGASGAAAAAASGPSVMGVALHGLPRGSADDLLNATIARWVSGQARCPACRARHSACSKHVQLHPPPGPPRAPAAAQLVRRR
jgi:hypothetical protein